MGGGGGESSSKSVTTYRTPVSYLPEAAQQQVANVVSQYMNLPTSFPISYGGNLYAAPAKGPTYGSNIVSALYTPTPAAQASKSESWQAPSFSCGMCFCFAEAEQDEKLKEVRMLRDEKFPKLGMVSSGYAKLSSLLVPLMRKSKFAKLLVKTLMTKPLISRAKFYYRRNKIGWLFIPWGAMWVATWYLIGKYSKAREYTWADFYGLSKNIPRVR